jgi:hypothetical protein
MDRLGRAERGLDRRGPFDVSQVEPVGSAQCRGTRVVGSLPALTSTQIMMVAGPDARRALPDFAPGDSTAMGRAVKIRR